MGSFRLRFNRRVRIAPGIRLNFLKERHIDEPGRSWAVVHGLPQRPQPHDRRDARHGALHDARIPGGGESRKRARGRRRAAIPRGAHPQVGVHRVRRLCRYRPARSVRRRCTTALAEDDCSGTAPSLPTSPAFQPATQSWSALESISLLVGLSMRQLGFHMPRLPL